MKRGTIETTFHEQQRVSFSCPSGGYCMDDLDALLVAVRHARKKICEQQSEDITFDVADAFRQQQQRMAAPS